MGSVFADHAISRKSQHPKFDVLPTGRPPSATATVSQSGISMVESIALRHVQAASKRLELALQGRPAGPPPDIPQSITQKELRRLITERCMVPKRELLKVNQVRSTHRRACKARHLITERKAKGGAEQKVEEQETYNAKRTAVQEAVAKVLARRELEDKLIQEELQQSYDPLKHYALPLTEQKIEECLYGHNQLVVMPTLPEVIPRFPITFGSFHEVFRPLDSISTPAWPHTPFNHSEASTTPVEEKVKTLLPMAEITGTIQADTADLTHPDNHSEADTEMVDVSPASMQPPPHLKVLAPGECSPHIIRSWTPASAKSDKENRHSTKLKPPISRGPLLMIKPVTGDGADLVHEVGFKYALPEDRMDDEDVVEREDAPTVLRRVKVGKGKPKFGKPLTVPDPERVRMEQMQAKRDKRLRKKKAPLLSVALIPNLANTLFQWHASEGSSRIPASKNITQIVFYNMATNPPTILLNADANANPKIQSITTATVNVTKPENYPTGLAMGFGPWFVVYIELPHSSRYPQGISEHRYTRLQYQQTRAEGNVTVDADSDEVVEYGPAWRVQHHNVFAFPENAITGRKVVMHNIDPIPILVSEGEGLEMAKRRVEEMEERAVEELEIIQQFTLDIGLGTKIPCVDIVVYECDKVVFGKAWEGVLKAFRNGMLRIEGWKKVESLADL